MTDRLVADGLKVHTLIAGKACDQLGAGQLKQVQSSLPNVSYIGWVSAEELAVVYASSDVLLFPSGVETFGNVTLEGMASGLPVIVDAASGSHLVDDGACACWRAAARDSPRELVTDTSYCPPRPPLALRASLSLRPCPRQASTGLLSPVGI